MGNDKHNLEKLLEIIYKISEEPGNEWFKENLKKMFVKNIDQNERKMVDNSQIQSPSHIYLEDIKRTRYFLQNIDKSFWIEGIGYYSKLKYSDLKYELVTDYKEMKIAEKQNDIIEYTRRIVLQLENCINYVCKLINVYSEIGANPNKYREGRIDLTQGNYSFFNSNGSPRSINDIEIRTKLNFLRLYYGLKYSFSDCSEMIKIRNYCSHRGKAENELEIIEKVKQNKMERQAAYFKCFDSIFKNMNHLFK